MESIFVQYKPAWDADVKAYFPQLTESYIWEQEGVNKDTVINDIREDHRFLVDQHGNTWELIKIEQYQGYDSECQFDWLLIARYKQV